MKSLRAVSLSRIGKNQISKTSSFMTPQIKGMHPAMKAKGTLPVMLHSKACGLLSVDDYRLSAMNVEGKRTRNSGGIYRPDIHRSLL